MLRSYDGLALRQLRTRRLRAALTAFGVVLGVGMVFGVLLLTSTIRATYSDLIDAAWGSKDLVATPATAGVLPERTLGRIAATPGVRSAAAMVGAGFVRLDRRGKAITGTSGRMMVAGYDPRQPAPYDFHLVAGRRMRAGPEVNVESGWARAHGIHVGGWIAVGTPVGPRRLHVVGTVGLSGGASFGGYGLALMPLGPARAMMAIPHGWLQISIAADDRGQAGALRARLQQRLGGGVKVQTPQGLGNEVGSQLRALDMVLYFFSGVALFVGGFLILNAFGMTVMQRTRELGMLRTLGATRRMIVRSVLVEAVVLALVGGVLGLGLGLGLSLGLIALMKGLGMPIGALRISAPPALVALALGVLTTLAGAWWPARRAGRVPPIRAILGGGEGRRRPRRLRIALGVALFVPGALFGGSLWFGGNASATDAMLGMLVTVVMFVGMVLAAPAYITPLVRVLAAPLRRVAPTGGRLAADAVAGNPMRTAATAVALTIGLSVVVVNAGMAQSFVGTIRDQIDRAYARDLTVQPAGSTLEQGGAQTIAPGVRAQIAQLPAAGVVSPLRVVLLQELPHVSSGKLIGLVEGVDPATFGAVDRTALDGVARGPALAAVARGGALIGPRYAKAAGLRRGDRLTLRGPAGTRSVPIAGVMRDMGAFNGQVLQVSLATLRAVYGVSTDAQLLVQARSPAQRAALDRQVGALIAHRHPELEALSTAQVKQQIDDEVTRQFNFFNAIVAIAIVVSLLGVVNTLAMSVAERTREIGLLRALGSSRLLVRLSTLNESLLITLAGAVAGVATGTLIAWLWVASLGDVLPGIGFAFPAGTAIAVAAAAVLLGTLAALLPARRASRVDILEALSYE